MRATSIEEVRSVRDSLNESYVVTTLSNISVAPELGEATVNGVDYKLSSRALQQLCQMLGVPLHFAKTLSEKMPDVFTHLTNRLVHESSRLVTIKVNGYPQSILGLFNPREDYITLKKFLGIVETIYKAMSDFSGVEKLVVDINHESATAFFYTPKEFSPIRKDFTDIFKFGVAFSVSTLEMYSPSVSESVYRLICSNMTYAPAFGGTRFRSRNEERGVGIDMLRCDLVEIPAFLEHELTCIDQKIKSALFRYSGKIRPNLGHAIYCVIPSDRGSCRSLP